MVPASRQSPTITSPSQTLWTSLLMKDSKETNKTLITGHKHVEIYEVSNNGFRVISLKKFSELHKNTSKSINEIRKTIHEQKDNFNKEQETFKNRTK